MGTFVANVLGSLVMALLFYGTRNSSSLTTGWSNVAIKAFQVGSGRQPYSPGKTLAEAHGFGGQRSGWIGVVFVRATGALSQHR